MGQNGCNRFALSYMNRQTRGIRSAAISPCNRFALIDNVLNIPLQAQRGVKIELGSELEKTEYGE